ncbi:lipopolysaccharide biosynthesis protein [Pseudoalteromonas rubra]|uniref:Lipopolysaccharide biosynthesis protein n=1 Tax=Pseudoalteromonas rubra TaxID=43658 RepID=A0A4Q7EDD7_9GAMM|nr:GNAT family N-acetyltransferase [Pseudoalteromonas rubra]RZM81165.1 lipopolysaccharide biosynthesis protein [Pseudoalteromonas rubra]
MKLNLTKNSWDSEFFGKPIYTLKLDGTESNQQAEPGALITAKIEGDDYAGIDRLNNLGFQLCEGEVSFIKRLGPVDTKLSIEKYKAKQSDIEKLEALCSGLYSQSRFRMPWFSPSERDAFYSLWIRKAVNGEFDDVCLTIQDNGIIKGFVSVKIHGDVAKIGLIGVNEQFQGQGIGKKLISLAEAYGALSNATLLSVATQSSNRLAMLLYSKSNFTIQNISYWFYKHAPF